MVGARHHSQNPREDSLSRCNHASRNKKCWRNRHDRSLIYVDGGATRTPSSISYYGCEMVDYQIDHSGTSPTTVYGGVYAGVYHTPLGRFSKLDCSTAKRVAIPNDTSSESSRRDVCIADLFGIDPIPTVEISTTENRPREL